MATQDPVGLEMTPTCLMCLRQCGSRLSDLRRALELVGEDVPDDEADEGSSAAIAAASHCATCGGPFCCAACAERADGGAHGRLCRHPAAPAIRALSRSTGPMDSVWLCALLISECALAVDAGETMDVARRRLLDEFHTHPWEEIPLWAAPAPAARALCERRRAVVSELSALLSAVYDERRYGELTSFRTVSLAMGALDTCCVSAWVRSRHNAGWSGDWEGGASQRLHELVPSIREAKLRTLERSRRGTEVARRQDEDVRARQAEPLFRGFPPSEAVALYPTLGKANHSCESNVRCSALARPSSAAAAASRPCLFRQV